MHRVGNGAHLPVAGALHVHHRTTDTATRAGELAQMAVRRPVTARLVFALGSRLQRRIQ